jgi:hypothetical protein
MICFATLRWLMTLPFVLPSTGSIVSFRDLKYFGPPPPLQPVRHASLSQRASPLPRRGKDDHGPQYVLL